jgi:hypothetical protein
MKIKVLTLSLILLCSLSLAAQASTVAPVTPFSLTDFVYGWEIYREPFTVPFEGTYKATIEDFLTPAPFRKLIFAVTTTAPISLIDVAFGEGGMDMFTFEGDPDVQYWANIFALTSRPCCVGLFGAEVSLIPIPPSLLLLGSGLAGLVILRRRRS